MEIIVRQISGLGNQLFQYAAGVYYAGLHNAKMRLVLDPPQRAFSYGSPRPFLLEKFAISSPATTLTAMDRFLLSRHASLGVPRFLCAKAAGIQVFREEFSKRYEFIQDLPIREGTQLVYLVGYWQTYRIPGAVESRLRDEFAFRSQPTGKNLAVVERIQRSRNPVSLHIRRGDFTLSAEGNIALPLSYYERAISGIKERLEDPTFFVFSDDMDFAKANLSKNAKLVFVDHNDHLTSHEDLRLMSSCHHHIIANSTFSWWGAWLNARSEKVVFAPKFWLLKPDSYFPGLLPPSWNLLD